MTGQMRERASVSHQERNATHGTSTDDWLQAELSAVWSQSSRTRLAGTGIQDKEQAC